jgi:cysteinyl-tRNA synthetase
MMLKLYNSMTKSTETFQSIHQKKVSMYVCGPTVYGDIHIGNARPVIVFDMLKRYLEHLDYEVHYVSNITDVDDKIIDKAKELNIDEKTLTTLYTKAFIEMSASLGSQLPNEMPKATHYIEQMITYIKKLIEKGYAYQTNQGVYFRVSKLKTYGQLSKQNIEELSEGVRIELSQEKEDPKDFTLWKQTDDGLNFESPFGKGRPGWHTECAVMNHEIFGEKIDIHGGGSDLIFPHHENEIAQSMAHDHHPLANFWMHVGRLDFNSEKMSKSLGNIIFVKDLIKTYNPQAFRLLMVSHHYRQPIQYQQSLMEQFSQEYERILRTMKKTALKLSLEKKALREIDYQYITRFEEAMNDDLNTPNVMTIIYELIKSMNKETDLDRLASLLFTTHYIFKILGIYLIIDVDQTTIETYQLWEQARTNKNYDEADRLRKILIEQGWL